MVLDLVLLQVVTVAAPAAGVASDRAIGIASIGDAGNGFNRVNSIFVQNAGIGYTSALPTVTISNPETISGVGTYQFNEIVQGMRSGTQARVKNWDQDTGILSISQVGIGTTTTGFFKGEDVKDLHLVHCLVFLFTIRMIAPINIMKVIYLRQKQTC